MKDDENIETMFSGFQVLLSVLRILNKRYITSDHVKKSLRSLPVKYRPKVAVIQEAKDLNPLSLESVVSNLQSHKMDLYGDELVKQFKTLVLDFVQRSKKYSQTRVQKEVTHDEESDNDEMVSSSKDFNTCPRRRTDSLRQS